jgi:hypothetical protein
MIDINTILTQALTAAVTEATKPLVERIATLEDRVEALAAWMSQAQATPAPQVEEAVSAYLDNAESFWHRIECFVQTRTADAVDAALDAHLENANHPDDDDIETAIDSAIERHEENRTHGDEDDIEEIVQKLLNSASISISV